MPKRAQQVSWNPVQEPVKETCTKIDFSLGYASRGSTRAYGISISIFRARAFEWSWFRLCWDSLRGDRARIWGRKKPGVLRPLPGDTFPSFLTASVPPPEAAPALGARPAFWPGQDPRSSQDQPGPPRPTAIKIIIGTGETRPTAMGAPPRMLRPPEGLPGDTLPSFLTAS